MIAVELLRTDLAEVVITPSLLRRIVFGEREVVRTAERGVAGTWTWTDSGRLVEPVVEKAIEREWWRSKAAPVLVRTAAPPA